MPVLGRCTVSPGLHLTSGISLDLDDKLWVSVREALELVLVQVHDEEFVRGRQVHRHLRELLVKVPDVSASFLQQRKRV